jgi:hypothetical protein
MSTVNQKFIEELKEFEYNFRDGMVFSTSQIDEIITVCEQIISIAKDNL